MIKNRLCLGLTLLFFLALYGPASAQYVVKEADTQYDLFNYDKAIDLYEQAYKKKVTLHTAQRLAECNAFIHNYKETESWYAIAISLPGSPVENHLNYAKALQSNSKYNEAKVEYRKCAGLDKTVTAAQLTLWDRSCDSAIVWMRNPGPYHIKNEQQLNSPQSDWGAVPYDNGIVFTSDRQGRVAESTGKNKPFFKFDGAKAPDKNRYGWTGNRYLRLYLNNNIKDSTATLPFPMDPGTDYHVGAASFTADGNEMYFTLTRIPREPKFINGKLATINVEIYSSKKDKAGKWSAPLSFRYNKVNEWSVGDPFITNDGKTLYFSSTMPGGKGGSDLYVCFRTDDGGWDKPINLSDINTNGNERTPYIDNDNNLFFSSDGLAGMGGLDIFKVVIRVGHPGTPQNLGYPINSPQDDFAYTAVSDTSGYLASDRVNGRGSDDIYSFSAIEQKKMLVFTLKGTVYNKATHDPIANTLVTLGGAANLKVATDSTGKYKFELQPASAYTVTAEKTSYRSDEAIATTVGLIASATLQRDLYLEQIEIDKAIRLENIYYDFDKWNIRHDAAVELDKLVKIMKDNPTIWIELGSHTDSRGNDAYNMALSQKRAESAVKYIISKGISRNRITAKGYGETQLLNRCTNGVKCTEAEHQLNRRTEFKIVKQ